jgi:hypothetical protein
MTEPARPLRILEIGSDCLFALAVPAQTDFYWTGIRLRGNVRRQFGRLGGVKRAFGPVPYIRSLLKLRRGEYDLLVVHAAAFAPWHPRSFLTALRSWNVLSPLGLFANFVWRVVHLFHSTPIVALDLGDSFGIGRHNFFLLDVSRIYFKRELPADRWHVFFNTTYRDLPGRRWRGKAKNRRRMRKLAPISYGFFYFPFEFSQGQKSSDIFFAGNVDPNSTVRSDGLPELLALRDEGYAIDIASERLPLPEFLRRLSAAWLAWSPGGFGWDCARHYEAPLAGTVPMMSYPTIVRHRPLRDGEHCILYAPEPGALASTVRAALADKERLLRMASAAQAHVREHHTLHARAEYVVTAALGRRLDGSSAGSPVPARK